MEEVERYANLSLAPSYTDPSATQPHALTELASYPAREADTLAVQEAK